MKAADTVLLTRRLSDLLMGGLPLSRSLNVLRKQSADGKTRGVLKSLIGELEAGRSLSQAMASHKNVFSRVYIGMVRSGESSGQLDAALNELAGLLETDMEARQRLRAALAYPAFLCTLAIGICVFLLGFVIPRFELLFSDLGQRLPWPTRMLLGFSSLLRIYGLVLFIPLGSAVVVGYRKRSVLISMIQRSLLAIPRLSDLWRGSLIHRWASIMTSLLKAGYPVSDALVLSRQAMNIPFFGDDLRTITRRVNEGASLKQALEGSSWFPPMIAEMIGAAEESGQLEIAFARIAASSRREAELQWKLVLSVLEPALIVGMGVIVGFVALAMLLPIFEMSGNIR